MQGLEEEEEGTVAMAEGTTTNPPAGEEPGEEEEEEEEDSDAEPPAINGGGDPDDDDDDDEDEDSGGDDNNKAFVARTNHPTETIRIDRTLSTREEIENAVLEKAKTFIKNTLERLLENDKQIRRLRGQQPGL